MNEIIEKLKLVKEKILLEKGGIVYFFGLLERTDLEDKWDLVISTDWIEKSNSEKDLIYTIEKLKEEFGDSLDFISRIVLFVSSEEFINDLGWALKSIGKETVTDIEERGLTISNGVAIRHLFVLVCDFSKLTLHEPVEVLSSERIVREPQTF